MSPIFFSQKISEKAKYFKIDTFLEENIRRGHRVSEVQLRDRITSKPRTLRAKSYALTADAIGSPSVPLKSGVAHPQLGRNYMMHLSPIVAGLLFEPTRGENRFIKQVGF